MNEEIPKEFELVSLIYSAPSYRENSAELAPQVFYNPFPELNDLAADDSRTAFPQRAKYCLPLDSIFIPSAITVSIDEMSEEYLMTLPAWVRESIAEKFTTKRGSTMLPREANRLDEFLFHLNHEIPHQFLGSALYKFMLRIVLAKLYTSLEGILVTSGSVIEIPLIPDLNGSKIQRQWAFISEGFKRSQIIDEAVSLLVGLICTRPDIGDDIDLLEQKWILEHENELKGFAGCYLDLRTRCNFKACKTDEDRKRLCAELIQYGITALKTDIKQTNTNTTNTYAFNGDIPELVQVLLANASRVDSQGKNFGDVMGQYFGFDLVSKERIGWLNVETSRATPDVIRTAMMSNDITLDDDAIFSMIHLMVFVESIRQQVCTGVGLLCPFWQGKCCDIPFFKELLERIYQRSIPWKQAWKRHWQPPPCLQ